MKKLVKLASISLASLLVIVIAAVLLLTSSPGENFIKGLVEDRLSAEIGLPVNIARFETNLWTRVHIDSITINSANSSAPGSLLYIGKVRVGYSLRQLLGNEIALKSLFIDGITLSIELDSIGRFGIPALDNPVVPAEASGEEPATFSIDTVSIDRIALAYLDPGLPLSAKLTGAVLSASGSRDGTYLGLLKAENIWAEYDSLTTHIRNLDVSASMISDTLRINHASADLEGISVVVSGELGLADTMTVVLDVSAKGSPNSLLQRLESYYDISQIGVNRISVNSRIEGNLQDPSVTLNADIDGLIVRGIAVQSAMISARYHDDLVQLDTFDISTLNGAISGSAETNLDTAGSSVLNVVLHNIDMSALWTAIYSEPSPYQGTLSGYLDAEGRSNDVTSWQAGGTVTGKDLKYLNRAIPDLTCIAKLESGRTSFSMAHGTDEISADLKLGEETVSGTFNFSIPDITALSRFIDQPELSGRLEGEGTIDGHYSDLSVHSTLYGSKILYRNFPIDTIDAEISYRDSALTVDNFLCEGSLDSIDARDPPFGLDSLAGSLTYQCRLKGPQEKLIGEVQVQLEKPRYGSYGLDSLSLVAELNGAQLGITELEIRKGEVVAELHADYDTSTASGSFELMLQPLSLAPDSADTIHDISEWRNSFGSVNGEFRIENESHVFASVNGRGIWLGLISLLGRDTTVTAGEIDFDLIVDGPYLTPDAIVDAKVRSLEVSGFYVDSISSHLRLMEDALILDSLVSYALGHTLRSAGRLELGISSEGIFEISDSASVTAELSTTNFDLTVLEDLIFTEGKINGVVSTSLDISGTLATPRFNGWLRAENGMILVEKGSVPVENIGLSLKFADSLLFIDSVFGLISNMNIAASGSLSTSDFESVRIDLDGDIGRHGEFEISGMLSNTRVDIHVNSDSLDLAVLQPFLTDVDSLSGSLNCGISFYGETGAPQIEGNLNIGSSSMVLPGQFIYLSKGSAAINFDKSRIIIDSASAILNGGGIGLSGVIAHEQGELRDLALNLHANTIKLQEPGIYSVSIDSAALNFGKHQENYVFEGDIVLGEARFTAGLKPASILPWVKSMETVDLELPELITRSRLNVRIRESDRLWVDNNLARIRLRAEMGIIGTPLRPNFTGLLKIEEGYLLYLDRRFHVDEGNVYFVDPLRFNPDIKLSANTEVTVYRRTTPQPYTIYIKADGLLDQLQYGLYSEPPLEKPDIVALLTLGATRTELSGDNGVTKGGLTTALKDRAAMLTSKRISSYLSRKAGSLFGFEEFTIQGNLFDINNSEGPQVTATKRLSGRVDLTYSTSVGHLNDQTMRLGYRLSSRFSLQGETDRQGRSGLDLKYGISIK